MHGSKGRGKKNHSEDFKDSSTIEKSQYQSDRLRNDRRLENEEKFLLFFCMMNKTL